MKTLLRLLLLTLLLAASSGALAARAAAEQKKIDYLIAALQNLEDATFIRNGSEYTPDRAADHLRRKLRHAGERIQTAEQFIDALATQSSISGEKYHVRLKDGRVLESGQLLRDLLSRYP